MPSPAPGPIFDHHFHDRDSHPARVVDLRLSALRGCQPRRQADPLAGAR